MTLHEAIEVRRSRRKYIPGPVDGGAAEKLRELVRGYNQAGNIRMELVFDNGNAFGGLRKSYGLFSGVTNYALLIAPKDDYAAVERLGYYGELFTLNAVALGLGTCWVGGSFDRKLCPVRLSGGELIYCSIAFGNVPREYSAKEKFIHRLIHRKTKTAEEMIKTDAPALDWFMDGMRAVQKAPSAVNRQPVEFLFFGGKVTAGIKNTRDIGSVFDLGIAKLHFELGASLRAGKSGKWKFGNYGEFVF